MISGILCILSGDDFVIGAFIGGVTEIVFSFVIITQSKDLTVNIA
jgi:hypothetical protein